MDKKEIYARPDIKITEKQILVWLNDFGKKDKNNEIKIKYREISEALGISMKCITNNITKLITKGYISRKKHMLGRNKKSGNSYTLLK